MWPGFNQRARPRPLLPAGRQEALPPVQHHHSARRPAENLLVSRPPQAGLASSAPPAPPATRRPLVHTCTQVPHVHTCTHTNTHTRTQRTLEPEWRLRPRPCLLAPTKTGDHTCSEFCSQGAAQGAPREPRRDSSGIRGDKGTPCTQSPAGLTRPSSGMWLKLTALSLTGITSATRSCLSQGHPFHVAAGDVVMQRPGSLGSFQGIFKGHSSFRVPLRTT